MTTALGRSRILRDALHTSANCLADDILEELHDRLGSPEMDYSWDPDEPLITPEDMIAEVIDNSVEILRDDNDFLELLACPYLAALANHAMPPIEVEALFYRLTRFRLFTLLVRESALA